MKGRQRRDKSTVFLRHAGLFFITLIFALLFGKNTVLKIKTKQNHAKQTDEGALDSWIDYAITHPPSLRSRYGLQEMGFVSFIYAEMIRRNDIDSLALIQEELYSFCPGAHSIIEGIYPNTKESSEMRFISPISWLKGKIYNRGTIFVVDNNSIDNVISLIHHIRHVLKSSIPIEVFYYGKEITESSKFLELFNSQHITSVDLLDSDFFDIEQLELEGLFGQEKQEAMKALAFLRTSFDEAIYIGGDDRNNTIFINRKPDDFFLISSYKKTGSLFIRNTYTARYDLKNRDRIQEAREKLLKFHHGTNDVFLQQLQSNLEKSRAEPFHGSNIFILDRRKPGVLAVIFFNAWLHSRKSRDDLWKEQYDGASRESLWLAFKAARIPFQAIENPFLL